MWGSKYSRTLNHPVEYVVDAELVPTLLSAHHVFMLKSLTVTVQVVVITYTGIRTVTVVLNLFQQTGLMYEMLGRLGGLASRKAQFYSSEQVVCGACGHWALAEVFIVPDGQ